MSTTFERPSYVDQDAVPVVWAKPAPTGIGCIGELHCKIDSIDHAGRHAKLIAGCVTHLDRGTYATANFELPSGEIRTGFFHGQITPEHAEHLVRQIVTAERYVLSTELTVVNSEAAEVSVVEIESSIEQ